jgi:hypothetical protein
MTLDEVRVEYAGTTDVDDDELFRLHFAPPEDVEATKAAGPMKRDYPFALGPEEVVAQALEARDARRISLSMDGVTVELAR